VDVIDLGWLPNSFARDKSSKPASKVHKVRLVWQLSECLPDSDQRYVVQRMYTLSLHDRSTLRKHLDSWVGPLSPTQLAGFDLETLIGRAGLVSIAQAERDGNIWANVETIVRLPKGMAAPVPNGYVRRKDRKDRPAEPVSEPEEPVDEPDEAASEAALYQFWSASEA
jgi:hypothetical protein